MTTTPLAFYLLACSGEDTAFGLDIKIVIMDYGLGAVSRN